jgi:hypothetical protein
MAKHTHQDVTLSANQPDEAKAEAPVEVRPSAGGVKPFKVTHNGKIYDVQAVNEREAWALCCDANRMWPSPKSGAVVAA